MPSPRLAPERASIVGAWFPGATAVADLSWDLVDTTVLHLRVPDVGDVVVKAAGDENAHLTKEIDAYRSGVLAPLRGRVPQLLGNLHRQPPVVDDGWEQRQDARALAWLDEPHRLAPRLVARLRDLLRGNRYRPSAGADARRLAAAQLALGRRASAGDRPRPVRAAAGADRPGPSRARPELEAAFVDGYGGDPRDPVTWRMVRLREAVGTACYAFAAGDEAFEAQGRAMVDEALAAF